MPRVSVQFEFAAADKISSRNLDRITGVVREWAADRFSADRVEASVREDDSGGDTAATETTASLAERTLVERIMSPDLKTHVEALDEFRDVLELYRTGKLHAHAASFYAGGKNALAEPGELLSFPPRSSSS